MKAAVQTGYGTPDVLQLADVEKPVPQDDEVLVKIRATSVTRADGMMRSGTPFYGRLFLGLTKPKQPIPGTGFAGVIEGVGSDVTQFEEGDRVFGETGVRFGANAEYVCVVEDGVIAKMPANMTFGEAAPVCDGAVTSLNFLRNLGHIQSGHRVLINGASGSLGTSAVQLGHYFDAEVTGVCGTSNVEMVKSLGADHVIDYRIEDFTESAETYDIIFDTVGKSSFSRAKGSLTDDGVYISPVLGLPLLLRMLWTSAVGRKKAKFSATGMLPESDLRDMLEELKMLIETGKLRMVIDRKYPLELIVEAHRYVDAGHKRGNVVVTLNHHSE